MIVVIGSPSARLATARTTAAGLGVAIAREAAAVGSGVQLVGRVGEDATGDAVLLDLASNGIGHVALLRTPAARTPVRRVADDAEARVELAAALDTDEAPSEPAPGPDPGFLIDADDLGLALRYLPDYRVIVVAVDLDEAAWKTVSEAAAWSGAVLVAVVAANADAPAAIPDDATVLERPAADADAAFAGLVGRYAAGLDAGTEPHAAFAAATAGEGWATVET